MTVSGMIMKRNAHKCPFPVRDSNSRTQHLIGLRPEYHLHRLFYLLLGLTSSRIHVGSNYSLSWFI